MNFLVQRDPEHIRLKFIAIKLKGKASAWLEQLKRSQERQEKPRICDIENEEDEGVLLSIQLYINLVPKISYVETMR